MTYLSKESLGSVISSDYDSIVLFCIIFFVVKKKSSKVIPLHFFKHVLTGRLMLRLKVQCVISAF